MVGHMSFHKIYFIRTINCIAFFLLFTCFTTGQTSPGLEESNYYRISPVAIPEGIVLEAGGLAFDETGKLGVCTRRGEVWVISNPGSENPTYKRYAHGLHEPLMMAHQDGSYFMTQRGELTKLSDVDEDGVADQYESIYSWDLNGNYHEYSYGPKFLPDGSMLVTLNLGWVGRGASESKWRGWMLQISAEGEMTPIATGMRSPAGFGLNAAGDIFYTENQGDWVGSGRMTHVEKGDFVGHPEGLKWSGEKGSPLQLKMEDIDDTKGVSLYDYQEIHPEVKPPSVWFPHTLMGISTSDLVVIPEGFGPFTDQLLVGDQGHSKIMRVYQEKVNGVYQGACFGFREGFASGVLRMAWGPDLKLYVGMTNRGWASTGQEPYGLERLEWTGRNPFEIKTINARSNGFLLTFTEPVDRASAANPESYSITDFTYLYHHLYGSPAIDQQERAIYKVEVDQEGLTAILHVEGLREGYIYEISGPGVRSKVGQPLIHPTAYFTLNQIPEGERIAAREVDPHAVFETVDLKSDKRVTDMPGSWLNGPDQTIEIGTLPGMRYDTDQVVVKAGSKIKWIFNNPDDMMHNLLIVSPGAADVIGNAALQLGLKGQEMGYIPLRDEILFHTNLLGPNSSDIIYFTAPEEPGEYMFVCTFPGHATTMRGVLVVEPKT